MEVLCSIFMQTPRHRKKLQTANIYTTEPPEGSIQRTKMFSHKEASLCSRVYTTHEVLEICDMKFQFT